jgi:hypothetical protein
MTSFPLGVVVQNQDATGRIMKWALELMGAGISYAPRIAIKYQVLADFVVEWTVVEWTEIPMLPAAVNQEYWTMYFDGSLMRKGRRRGASLCFPSRGMHEVCSSRSFPCL